MNQKKEKLELDSLRKTICEEINLECAENYTERLFRVFELYRSLIRDKIVFVKQKNDKEIFINIDEVNIDIEDTINVISKAISEYLNGALTSSYQSISEWWFKDLFNKIKKGKAKPVFSIYRNYVFSLVSTKKSQSFFEIIEI